VSGASIDLRGVSVAYPDRAQPAVDRIDLSIAGGTFVTLVGPSGCGKSTLLRTINRLVPLSAGRVEIDGTDAASLDPIELRRSIGYAIQAVGLFAHMSVGKNVAIVPTLLGWERTRIDARVDEMLDLVRLDPARYRARRPSELSGGEAQRVGVARALAGEPRILLMDEPFGALDAIVRRELQHELQQIVARLKTTVVFVTHDVIEAQRLGDRIVVMRNGAIEQDAPPEQIVHAPATPFVRELFA
jgi:osmoprotectant transport system ATP-binding protein